MLEILCRCGTHEFPTDDLRRAVHKSKDETAKEALDHHCRSILDAVACLWEVATGKMCLELPAEGNKHRRSALQFSPDGSMLAAVVSKSQDHHSFALVTMWNTSNWQFIQSFDCAAGNYRHCHWIAMPPMVHKSQASGPKSWSGSPPWPRYHYSCRARKPCHHGQGSRRTRPAKAFAQL